MRFLFQDCSGWSYSGRGRQTSDKAISEIEWLTSGDSGILLHVLIERDHGCTEGHHVWGAYDAILTVEE